jgi:hypothetical protein
MYNNIFGATIGVLLTFFTPTYITAQNPITKAEILDKLATSYAHYLCVSMKDLNNNSARVNEIIKYGMDSDIQEWDLVYQLALMEIVHSGQIKDEELISLAYQKSFDECLGTLVEWTRSHQEELNITR